MFKMYKHKNSFRNSHTSGVGKFNDPSYHVNSMLTSVVVWETHAWLE